jgi:hypothetical protein
VQGTSAAPSREGLEGLEGDHHLGLLVRVAEHARLTRLLLALPSGRCSLGIGMHLNRERARRGKQFHQQRDLLDIEMVAEVLARVVADGIDQG